MGNIARIAERACKTMHDFGEAVKNSRLVTMRPKVKIEYRGRLFWGRTGMPIPNNRPHLIILRITFTDTGARGIMYARPDALPHKYGME